MKSSCPDRLPPGLLFLKVSYAEIHPKGRATMIALYYSERDEVLRTFLNAKQVGRDWEIYQTPALGYAIPAIDIVVPGD